MKPRRYYTKPGYKIRTGHAEFPDVQPDKVVYQPYVYELAKYIAKRDNLEYIIDIGAGNGEKLKDVKNIKIIGVDNSTNIGTFKKNLPKAKAIECDLEKGLPSIANEILQSSIVISSDVIEHIVQPHQYLKGLSKWSKVVPYVLVSTPDRTRARGPEHFGPPHNPYHVREWSIDELYLLFKKYDMPCLIGHTVSNDKEMLKNTTLAISGTHISINLNAPQKSVLAIMTTYNEEDIVGQSIQHLLEQGCYVHVIDNWSTDPTSKIIKKMAATHDTLSYERFPKKQPQEDVYNWSMLLTRIEEVAHNASQDWIIHNDADELRLSPWKNTTLQQAISFVDSLGYTAIDFTIMDFRPTKDGFSHKDRPDNFYFGFELGSIEGYFTQIKGWKNISKVELVTSGGHNALFSEQKIFPLKFISKHYSLRSSQQAQKKVFKERLGRYAKAEKNKGWHVHYDNYGKESKFIWSPDQVKPYSVDTFYSDYIVERLSGIGIKRENSVSEDTPAIKLNESTASKEVKPKQDRPTKEDIVTDKALLVDLEKARNEAENLKAELKNIKQSKSYKLATRLSKVKGKLSK